MRFIEVRSRNKRGEMMDYKELNGWLRKKARRALVVCYYWGEGKTSKSYMLIDGENTVPATLNGKVLEKVEL